MTLLEMSIAAAIGSMVVIYVVGILIFGARMATATTLQNHLDGRSRARVEMIKNNVRMSKGFRVLNGGWALEITNVDDTVSRYRYRDADGNPATAANNELLYRKHVNDEETRVLNWIDQGNGPIFQHSGGVAPLAISLRLGDPASNQQSHLTGIGTQAVDVVTTITERNR